jgi:protein involved in polysaccharide export with SLBB domain
MLLHVDGERAFDRMFEELIRPVKDVIQIRVLNQPDLDVQVRVAPDGTISFPYVGRFRAAGLPEDEVAARIRAALARAGIIK